MKLYSKDTKEEVEIGQIIRTEENETNVECDIHSLENYVVAYDSLTTVYSQVSLESFSFVEKGNYILYNEYIKSITSKLDIKPMYVSEEAIQTLPTVALNHHISLEGFIGDMWKKIKELFIRIYNKVKEFFSTYFTRLGRLKKRLENLKEVLNETDKDIQKINLDNVPSGIANKYPINGDVNFNEIKSVFSNVQTLGNLLKVVNTESKSLANKEILDKTFVSNIKTLRDKAKQAGSQMSANDANKTTGIKKFYGEGKENNKKLDTENKDLDQIKKDAEKEASEKEDSAVKIGNSSENVNIEFDDKDFIAAKKEFTDLLSKIESEYNKLKGKSLPEGRVVTKVTVNEDSGIDIEFDTNKEKPSSINLTSKTELKKLIDDSISLLKDIENHSNAYSSINETVIKNLDTVDSIVKDIDGIDVNSLGKYKAVLNNKVKERLKLMKTFFNNYNKVNKDLFSSVLSSIDGNIEYTTLCLKNFG